MLYSDFLFKWGLSEKKLAGVLESCQASPHPNLIKPQMDIRTGFLYVLPQLVPFLVSLSACGWAGMGNSGSPLVYPQSFLHHSLCLVFEAAKFKQQQLFFKLSCVYYLSVDSQLSDSPESLLQKQTPAPVTFIHGTLQTKANVLHENRFVFVPGNLKREKKIQLRVRWSYFHSLFFKLNEVHGKEELQKFKMNNLL